MKKILFIMAAVWIVASPASARFQAEHLGGSVRGVPTPTVIEPDPVNGEVNLAGKEWLRFEWTPEGDSTRRRYYDFRVYKGLEMNDASMIFKDKITTFRVELTTDLFQDGQVYMWTVRQVYDGHGKSLKNWSSFRAVKKA